MAVTKIQMIVSPFHVGLHSVEVGAGPDFILKSGVVDVLKSHGKDVAVETIPSPPGDVLGEVGRSFAVMQSVSKAVQSDISAGRFPIVLAGNCNNSVGTVAGLGMNAQDQSSVVWFDAHPDFDTPDEQVTGYFDVNGVSLLGGQCWSKFRATIPGHSPLDLKRQFTYVGLRDFNSEDQPKKITDAGIGSIWAGSRTPKEGFEAALDELLESQREGVEGGPCAIHFDVDSLDSSVGIANFAASAGGLSKDDAVHCVRMVKKHRRPASLTVASFDPSFDNPEGIADAAIAVILETVN